MNCLLYFFIYSVAGFITETVYTYICEKRYSVRRSMLYSPMCIVYGLGGAVLAEVCTPFDGSLPAVFAVGFIACSAVEYAASLLYEKICGVLMWDYSSERANLNGRVCARYSLYWGIIAVVFCRFIHPSVKFFLNTLDHKVKIMFLTVALIYFFKDLKITVREMKKFGKGEKSMCDGVLEYLLPAPNRKIF